MLQRWKQLNNNYSSNEWFFGSFCVQIVISQKIPCGFEAAWKVSHHLVWCSLVLSYGYWNVTQSFVLMWIRAMFLLSITPERVRGAKIVEKIWKFILQSGDKHLLSVVIGFRLFCSPRIGFLFSCNIAAYEQFRCLAVYRSSQTKCSAFRVTNEQTLKK